MSQWTVVGLVVGACVAALAAGVIALRARRHRRGLPARPPPREAPSPTAGGGPLLSRRDLVNQGLIGAFVAALSGLLASVGTFLWPTIRGGGRHYAIGLVGDVRKRLAVDRRPYVGGNGEFYLVRFPPDRLPEARGVYPPQVLVGMEAGLVALSPICTHQGCRVPYCVTSRWFECPCHGSRYDGVGEMRRGPAPRGLDHFAVTVRAGVVMVDTTRRFFGPPPGTETVHDPAAGRHCY